MSQNDISLYLSSRHHNIKFTMETEVNKVIDFLDVLVDNLNKILNTTLIINRLFRIYYLILILYFLFLQSHYYKVFN